MRNGQHSIHHNKRMRGRNNNNNSNNNNNRRNHNPLTRVYESNGPDVKIRGTANHVAEKYLQLARDAQTSGDPVSAENYFQHAEHYFRLIAAAQEQFRQQQSELPAAAPRGRGGNDQQFQPRNEEQFEERRRGRRRSPSRQQRVRHARAAALSAAERAAVRAARQQNYQPREHATAAGGSRPSGRSRASQREPGNVDALPAFITGGAPQPAPPQAGGQNGYENGGQPDRFPLHRRRRRHRGPRDNQGPQGGDRPDDTGT